MTEDGAAQVSRLGIPRVEEIDFRQLRAGRLERLQAAMRHHGLAVCLFFSPANIRYATGADAVHMLSYEAFDRWAVVPADGEPVVWEFAGSMRHSQKVVRDVRPARGWAFSGVAAAETARAWAKEIRSVMDELGVAGEPLAVDRIDVPGLRALEAEGIRVVDPGPATVEARDVKTPEEIELFKINGAIGSVMLSDFEAAIRPGVREYELLAVLQYSLVRHHGEAGFLRFVASGQNTNPWYPEAHDKMVMPGDLVALDTDAHGYQGYVIDVSRTFLCGDAATKEQKEAYRVAYEAVTGMVELVRPGMSYREFAEQVPDLPEKYKPQRYAAMAHTVGLEDGDAPYIPYPDVAPIPDWEIKENMVMNFECYAGEVGAPFGVKLEDQVLITDRGAELLVTYPYEAGLLG